MFKTGDLVIGKPNNCYAVTSSKSICMVLDGSTAMGRMTVKVLYNGEVGECAMDEYYVQSDSFYYYTKELAMEQGVCFMNEKEQDRYVKTLCKAKNKHVAHSQLMHLAKKFKIAVRSNRDRVLLTNINDKEELILTQLDTTGYTCSEVEIAKISLSDIKPNTFRGCYGLAGFRGIGQRLYRFTDLRGR
jgi:hypothetical protein